MTSTDLLREFKRLPLPEQTALASAIERQLQVSAVRQGASDTALQRLRGCLNKSVNPPGDAEVDVLRDQYFTEKFR